MRRTLRRLARMLLAADASRLMAFRLLRIRPRTLARVAQLAEKSRPELSLTVRRGPLRGARFGGLLPGEIVPLADMHMERASTELLARQDLAGACVFDIGASYGYYAILLSRLVGPTGHVHSFEPDPESYRRLLANLELNDCTNTVGVPLAVSDRTGIATYTAYRERPWLGHLGAHDGGERIAIGVTSIDEYCELLQLRPALIKLDVEGAECAAVQGAGHVIEEVRPLLLIEAHGDSAATQLDAYLTARGYVMRLIEAQAAERQHLLFQPIAPLGGR